MTADELATENVGGRVEERPTPPGPAPTPTRSPERTRGRKQSHLGRLRGEIPMSMRVALISVGIVVPFIIWIIAAALTNKASLVPTPGATWSAGWDMASSGELWGDLWASTRRVLIGYGISVVLGVGIGVLIGSFRSIESFAEPQIGFLRYIPATALLPVFLFWLGIDETPKIALIVVGTIFYNILMSADVARAVPRELIGVSYTLGAGRLKVLRKVIFPHSLPGLIDVARINLAAAWLMLVVAELLAAPDGLALRISRAQRFRQVDRMFALLIVFGIIGVLSDLFLRWLRNRSSPWARP